MTWTSIQMCMSFCLLRGIYAIRTETEVGIVTDVGLPDCETGAKQMYQGGAGRFMTKTSCMRANLIVQKASQGASSCQYVFKCEGKPDLGLVDDKKKCWAEKTWAIGTCVDENPPSPPASDAPPSPEVEVMMGKEDISEYIEETFEALGKEELPEAEDEQLQEAPADKPYQRVCCRMCGKGKACGHSCISRKKECSKGQGCACDRTPLA
mmetsp:Transcript_55984/g.103560  ORF Transcript_55984/g.103560 Transcript_55984/m.103560 type:complete len:209 (-) Transcript_55984:26-652(-)